MEATTISRHDFFRLLGTSIGTLALSKYSMGCAHQNGGDPAPVEQKIDFTLRLSDQINENLRAKGGYVIANDVIIAQTQAGQYIAVGATCTCATPGTQLVYKAGDNQFYCPLHLSRYDSTGKVLVGPATKPLVQYKIASDKSSDVIHVYQ